MPLSQVVVLTSFFRNTQTRTREDSLSSDIAATRKAGIRTAILVTLLVSGIVPAVCMMFNPASDGVPFVQHLQQMWSIALMTYPLTIVVATLTILRKRGLLNFGNLFLTMSIIIFCVSVGNTIGVFGGHEVATPQAAFSNQTPIAGYEAGTSVAKKSPTLLGLPAACIGFFTSYLRLYGLRTFLASVLVGVFAGSTASRFLHHIPTNSGETVGLAKEIYESHRRARSA